MADPSYYELLGVDSDASAEDIKTAFRNEAKRNHPDTGGNPVLFQMINDAYQTLSDDDKRRRYDASVKNDVFAGTTSHATTSTDGPSTGQYHRDESWQDWDWDQGNDEPTRAHSLHDREPKPGASANNTTTSTSANDDSRKQTAEPGDPLARDVRPYHPVSDRTYLKRRFNELFRDRSWRPIAFWTAVLWSVCALALGLQIIPGVANTTTLTVIVVLMVTWSLGSIFMRLLGWLLLIVALWNSQVNDVTAVQTASQVGFAFVIWLSGHWLFTFRNNEWRALLAKAVLERLPGPLHPKWRHYRREQKVIFSDL